VAGVLNYFCSGKATVHFVFRYYLKKGKIFSGKSIGCKIWFLIFSELLSKTGLSLRKILRDIKNVRRSSYKVAGLFLSYFNQT